VSQVGPILVVEDDRDIQGALCDLLTLKGYQVVAADHGGIALDIVQHERVGLILLDMKMPVMDGWEFAREYRARVTTPAPVVVLTAARDAAKWAGEVEATAYLSKPFELDELLVLVKQLALPSAESALD
jgi:CheY-like chemotaxis protein